MHPIVSTTLFISYVSALNSHLLDLQPLITPSPQVQVRDVAQSICGYYSTNGLVATLACPTGTPCLVAQTLSPAILHCSNYFPVTAVYPYPTTGCGAGSQCCPASAPSPVKFTFSGGSTVSLGCSTGLSFSTYSAFFSSQTPAPDKSTSTTSSTTTSSTTSSITTSSSTTSSSQAPAVTVITQQPSPAKQGSGTSNKATFELLFAAVLVALIDL